MRVLLLASSLVLLTACGSDDPPSLSNEVSAPTEFEEAVVDTSPSTSYDEAHAAAVAALAVASDKGHAWNVTDHLLLDASEAAAAGDTEQAIVMADEARIQAQLAAIQADREAIAWRDNIISD